MRLIKSLLDLAWPRLCLCCGGRLHIDESYLCGACLVELPRTRYHLYSNNEMLERFQSTIPIERATAFVHYERHNPVCSFFQQLKYGGEEEIGLYFGALYGRELAADGFLDNVDLLVPVPLSPHKLRRRGYNQATAIARGISRATGIPLAPDTLIRISDLPAQARNDRQERWKDTPDYFVIGTPPPADCHHFALVDDILTTGSTLTACARPLLQLPDTRLTLLTLGVSRL